MGRRRGESWFVRISRAVDAVTGMSLEEFVERVGKQECLDVLKEHLGEDLAVKMAEADADPEDSLDEEKAVERDREER